MLVIILQDMVRMSTEQTNPACANPVFLGFVKTWLDTALHNNTQGFNMYRNAYNSLRACPIEFQHPSELQQLRGFGPKLCERLTTKYKEYCVQNGLTMPKPPQKRKAGATDDTRGHAEAAGVPKPKKKAPKRQYTPSYRSGAYALIMGLSSVDEDSAAAQGLVKQRVIDLARPHCDMSFKAPPDPSKFYTAWNSMATLINKDLVTERGRPLRKYALTDEGWEIAKRLRAAAETMEQGGKQGKKGKGKGKEVAGPLRGSEQTVSTPFDSDDEVRPESSRPSNRMINPEEDDIDFELEAVPITDFTLIKPACISSNAFTVELVIDVREVRSKKDRDYMQQELEKVGVTPIVRSMELGDAQWVAKMKDPLLLKRLGSEGDELVLDHIVERKCLDDLIASIKDGRFQEQKFRLRRSGIENVVYVVEEPATQASIERYHTYEESVTSALASLQVVSGCYLRQTRSIDETVRYLARMTRLLRKVYASKRVHVVPAAELTVTTYLPALKHFREAQPEAGFYVSYEAFAAMASKSDRLTLRDVFLKMLMTTRGVTAEKAIEIQSKWRTPIEFVEAFEKCGEGPEGARKKRYMVAQELNHLVGRQKITKPAGVRLAEVWGDL